jgi:putative oxidoreductase
MHAHAIVAPLRRATPLQLVRDALGILEHFPLSILLLMARIGVGAVFFKSGLVKIASWQATVQLFAFEYRVPLLPPELAATLAASVELTAPVLLFIGFGARFAATAMLGMTLVIEVFVYPANWAEHLTWASLLALVITHGAGTFSIDRWIARRFLGGSR